MTPTLFVCVHHRLGGQGSCSTQGSETLITGLEAEIARRGLGWKVQPNTCLAHCGQGPNLKAAPGGPLLTGCQPGDEGRVVDQLLSTWIP